MEYDILVKKLPEGLAYRPIFIWNAPLSAAQGHVAQHAQGDRFLAAPLCEETLRYSRELSVSRSVDTGKLTGHADLVASGMVGLYQSAAIHNGTMQNPARAARQEALQQDMDFACKVSQHQRECRLYAQLPLADKFKINAQRRQERLEEDFRDAMAGGVAYFAMQEAYCSGFTAYFIGNIPVTEDGLVTVRQIYRAVAEAQAPERGRTHEHDFLRLATPQGEPGDMMRTPQLGLYRYAAKSQGLCA
ncbi:MAG: hypothetical protein WC043_05695 [Pseudobdellovibrionaceae bacterium]